MVSTSVLLQEPTQNDGHAHVLRWTRKTNSISNTTGSKTDRVFPVANGSLSHLSPIPRKLLRFLLNSSACAGRRGGTRWCRAQTPPGVSQEPGDTTRLRKGTEMISRTYLHAWSPPTEDILLEHALERRISQGEQVARRQPVPSLAWLLSSPTVGILGYPRCRSWVIQWWNVPEPSRPSC